jgi:isopenicillin N synthase-like dioxygenase
MLAAARTLAKALAAALGEPEHAFDDAMHAPASVLILLRVGGTSALVTFMFLGSLHSVLYANLTINMQLCTRQYDPAKLAGGSENNVGCGAHTDCGFLTLLAQEAGSAPLQVQRGAVAAGNDAAAGASGVDDEAWVEAPPKEGHVLVNIGDMLARWTNGRYRSTVHRVLLERGDGNARHSVACFANPSYYTRVECYDSCVSPAAGMPVAQFEPITAGKYISQRLGLMYTEEPVAE